MLRHFSKRRRRRCSATGPVGQLLLRVESSWHLDADGDRSSGMFSGQEIMFPGPRGGVFGFDAEGLNLILPGPEPVRCPITESADGFQRSLGRNSAQRGLRGAQWLSDGRLSADGRMPVG